MDGKTTLKYIVIGIAGWFTFKGARSIFGVVICLCVLALPFQFLYSAFATTAEELNVVKIWSMQKEVWATQEAEAAKAAAYIPKSDEDKKQEQEKWKTWALETLPKLNPNASECVFHDDCEEAIEKNDGIALWCSMLYNDAIDDSGEIKKWARLNP